ncbi:LysR family transcriptional regulator [Marinobacter sp. C2H3]|uniref:LysR family transcriptional regulator n=1 Tax=Marinobacter sp. C2H3 TaxID=3119003 RepID=UPI00300EA94D
MLNWQDLQIFLEVARTERLSDAARRLNIDHSTVSRRIRRFENSLNTQLFERSTHGYRLTDAGQQLRCYAETMEHQAAGALDSVSNQNLQVSGAIRLGVTEGFGTYVITPLLSAFTDRHPDVTVELLPLPRVVNLSRHEADLAITVERPANAEMVISRLCDYRLTLYGQRDFLQKRKTPGTLDELATLPLIGYVDDLIFSDQLCYLDPIIAQLPDRPDFSLRSTSIITQLHAIRSGMGAGILPCFMASQDPELVPLLEPDIDIVRSFWIAARTEQRNLLRVKLLWQFLKDAVAINQAFLMGDRACGLQLPCTGGGRPGSQPASRGDGDQARA